jgi:hypothetical protein
MTVLDSVLQEEYERSKKIKTAMERELRALPSGYISKKTINKNIYYYLQKRVGLKIIGDYIPPEALQQIKDQVARRKQLEKSIRELEENIKKIQRVVK